MHENEQEFGAELSWGLTQNLLIPSHVISGTCFMSPTPVFSQASVSVVNRSTMWCPDFLEEFCFQNGSVLCHRS